MFHWFEGFLGSSFAGGTGLPGSAGTSGVGGVVSGSLGTGVGGVGVSGSLGTSGVGGVGVSGSLGTSVSVVLALYLLQSFVDLRFDRLLLEVYLLQSQCIVSAKLITWFIFICIFFNNFSVY